jgi:hypothetical protein
MIGFRPTLSYRCARRRALNLAKPNARSLLLACGGKEIRQNSAGRFSDGDRRWRTITHFDRLSAAADTSKYHFGLSESLVRRGDSEVLIHVSLREIGWRDQIEPVILTREGGGDRRLSRAVSCLRLDPKGSCLRSHSEAREKVPRFGDGVDL